MLTQQMIRARNLRNIYQMIDQNAGISRASLAKQSKLSKTTVSSLVDELIAGKYIEDCGVTESRLQGRHPNELRVDGEDNVVAVISWRRTRLDFALVSSDSTLAFRDQLPISEKESSIECIRHAFFDVMLPEVGKARLMGVCIIVPGIVDDVLGRINSTVLGIGFSDPVVQQLTEMMVGYPLCILNDTACFAYAESVFTRIEDPFFAYINVSRGVGACLFADGKMLRGAGGMSTQFGHFSIDHNGPQCLCGNKGCLERLIGEYALEERAEKCGLHLDLPNGRRLLFSDIGALADEGNEAALHLIRDLAQDLAFGLSNLISMFNPSLIVIGGTGVNLGPVFLKEVHGALSNIGFREFVSRVKLQYSRLGLDSELTGAAQYYINHHYDFSGEMPDGPFLR